MAVANKENMLDVVAVPAKGLESAKPLITCPMVILPELVAVEATVASAYLAAAAGASVDASPQAVPLGLRKEPGESGQARGRGERLNSETQRCHV
jgi:hypothetical protein